MKKPKKKLAPVKPTKAWALIDPNDRQILSHQIYDHRVRSAGYGSVTDGLICIRVEIHPVKNRR